MGVGFTIMMAGLMQGSQVDFLRQLVDAMPHITVTDEKRSVANEPAEQEFGAVGVSNTSNRNQLDPALDMPNSIVASLESWVLGAVAASVKTNAIILHGAPESASL